MTAVSWHVVMSLDGFIAAPGDDMRWIFELAGPSDSVDDVVANTGAIIMGRRTYAVEDRDRPGIYGGAWNGPFFVLTHEAPASVPDWMTGTFVDEGIEDAVARAKTAAGQRNVGILGASVAHSASTPACSTRSSSRWRPSCSATGSASSTIREATRSSSRSPMWPNPGN